MSEERLEFKVKPFYLHCSSITILLFAIWSVTQLTWLLQTKHNIYLLTLISGLFATFASIVAALRYRKNPALIITRTSVSVMYTCFSIENIVHIELYHPTKIVFWIKSETSEYKKKLNLNFIRNEEHQRVRSELQSLKDKIRESNENGI
jgi:hypothetical protein